MDADTCHAQILARRAAVQKSKQVVDLRGVLRGKPPAVATGESLRSTVAEREDPHGPSVAALRKGKPSGDMSGFDHLCAAEAVQLIAFRWTADSCGEGLGGKRHAGEPCQASATSA